jgi:hypothetical protein
MECDAHVYTTGFILIFILTKFYSVMKKDLCRNSTNPFFNKILIFRLLKCKYLDDHRAILTCCIFLEIKKIQVATYNKFDLKKPYGQELVVSLHGHKYAERFTSFVFHIVGFTLS